MEPKRIDYDSVIESLETAVEQIKQFSEKWPLSAFWLVFRSFQYRVNDDYDLTIFIKQTNKKKNESV